MVHFLPLKMQRLNDGFNEGREVSQLDFYTVFLIWDSLIQYLFLRQPTQTFTFLLRNNDWYAICLILQVFMVVIYLRLLYSYWGRQPPGWSPNDFTSWYSHPCVVSLWMWTRFNDRLLVNRMQQRSQGVKRWIRLQKDSGFHLCALSRGSQRACCELSHGEARYWGLQNRICQQPCQWT